MKLESLELTNYRNHQKLKLNFMENTTLITGPNGSGKTNILEAIHLLSTTKPFRGKYDKDIISHETNFARIEALVNETKLEFVIMTNPRFDNASIKKVKVNGVAKTLYGFASALKSVLFSPENIELITASPSHRRKYLDSVLSQVSVDYKRALHDYTKAVRQRNKLLETINETGRGLDQLEFWDAKVVALGITIQEHRTNLFTFMQETLTTKVHEIDPSMELQLCYAQSAISKDRITSIRQKEIWAKRTLVGPHRDDFLFLLEDKNLAEFGSRGQQRTAILALKLGEIDFIENQTNERPILLLDDVFSEFDEAHKEAVLTVLDKQQTVITSTNPIDALYDYQQVQLN